MENRLTTAEERFLKFYDDVTKKGLQWTFRMAAVHLRYKSTGSVMRIIDSLRLKGYPIETKRSEMLQWRRKTVNNNP